MNELENLLRKAVGEPTYMAAFLNKLLTEKLFVITNYNDEQAERNEVNEDQQIGIFRFDDGRVPIFTSEERTFDRNVFRKKDVKLLTGNGEYLFKLLSGSTLIVNPYSQYAKELSPQQMERLLNGTYFTGNLIHTGIESGMSVTFSQPEIYPTEIVKSLIIFFTGKPDVKKAYLALVQNQALKEPEHYIFAIETVGEMVNLSSEAIYITKSYLPADEIVDFIQIDKSSVISRYFIENTKPFYEKTE